MRTQRLLGLAMTVVFGSIGAAACSSTSGGGGTSTTGTGTGGSAGALQWYTTCGAPVCSTSDAGTGGGPAACTTQKAGDPCTMAGATCDPGLGCQQYLECASSDPKLPGCPVSRARYKKEIAYVSDATLESVHDELMTMRLATWRYTAESERTRPHLGFIIDDDPESAAVDATGEHVDLYGYTSMAVAAAQVEHRRVEALEREVRALREAVAAMKRCDP
jgi:hypothetical protein